MGAPQPKEVKKHEDVLLTSSNKAGMGGVAERLLRRFRTLSFMVLLLPVGIVCCLSLGVSLAPAIWFYVKVQGLTGEWPEIFKYLALGCAFALGYLIYGLTLIFVIPFMNFMMPFRVKPFRGPYYSLSTIPWYVHNALTYMVRFTFLDFVTPTPINILFYRMMGMKIGKGVVINTTYISDPSMITIEDYVTVGGSATIFAHYGQKGYLVIAPVRIGKGTNVGLKASVMGGAQVGENVVIKPHSTVLPKAVIGDGEIV